MRRLTLCLPYYMNGGMLERQLQALAALPSKIRDQLELIVVDDGSPDNLPQPRYPGLPFRLYRIGVDIRWNQDAARNIAMHETRTQWNLLTDIDHLVPRETFEAILARKLDKSRVYRFSRCTLEKDGKSKMITPYKPHPNSWLMTKRLYDQVGGYDERFAGHYGTDAEFRDRIAQHAEVDMLMQLLWRVPRTTIPDASTTTYTRKGDPIDLGAIPRIKAERAQDPDWRPLRLQFPYKLVYDSAE